MPQWEYAVLTMPQPVDGDTLDALPEEARQVFTSGWVSYSHGPRGQPFPVEEQMDQVRALGEEGWELVAVREAPSVTERWFKRPRGPGEVA